MNGKPGASFLLATLLVVGGAIGVLQYMDTHPPVADAGSDIVIDIGETAYFDGSASQGEDLSYKWYFHDNGEYFDGVNSEHVYEEEGVYHVTLMVQEQSGDARLKMGLDTVKVTVHNLPPDANAGGDITCCEDEEITFDASATTDTENDLPTLEYDWDLGDGTLYTGASLTHTYLHAGEYHALLKVTDNDGALGYDYITVNVENQVPVADAGPDQAVCEYDPVDLSAVGTTDTPSDLPDLRYHWDLGDGITTSGMEVSHRYTKQGTYTATLTVTDDNGVSSRDTCLITVSNNKPVADSGSYGPVSEGKPVFFDGVDTEDTPNDVPLLDYGWSFGKSGESAVHTFSDDGRKNVELTVTDDDSAVDTNTVPVTVDNYAPLTGITDAYVMVNLTLRLTGEKWHDASLQIFENDVEKDSACVVREPGNPDDQSVTIYDVRLDLTESYDVSVTYTPENDPVNGQPLGANPVWVIIDFDDGSESLKHTFNVVQDHTYDWEVDLDSVLCGHTVTYEGYAFDYGADDITLRWDWGDGTETVNSYPGNGVRPMYVKDKVEHKHTGEYDFGIVLYAEDDDGGMGEHQILLHHGTDSVYIDNLAPKVDAGNDASAAEDESVAFSGYVFDTLQDSITDTEWHLGDHNTDGNLDTVHAYTDEGTYYAVLFAYDTCNAVGVDHRKIEISNVVPSADFTLSSSDIYEDGTVDLSANAQDTSSDMPRLKYYWDYGDGTYGVGAAPSHVYTKEGAYNIGLTVVDDNGAVSERSRELTVNNIGPSVELRIDTFTYKEDEIIIIEADASDTATDEAVLNYAWDLGDGLIQGGDTVTTGFGASGTYTIGIQVTDDNDASGFDSSDIHIENVPPDITTDFDKIYLYGKNEELTFRAPAIDTYSDYQVLEYNWNFGDGASSYSATHQYSGSDVYTVTVLVTDGDEVVSPGNDIIASVALDSDGDNIKNEDEVVDGTDPDNYDSDGDDLIDYVETNVYPTELYPTDPTLYDTDEDGLNDWYELAYLGWTLDEDYDGDGIIPPLDWDSDGDMVQDGDELEEPWNPTIYNDVDGLQLPDHKVVVDNELMISVAVKPGFDFTIGETSVSGLHSSLGEIEISSAYTGSFNGIIKAKYHENELSTGIEEESLKIYRYIDESSKWENLLDQSGTDSDNDFMWAKVTEFSTFGRGDSKLQDVDFDGLTDWEEENGLTRDNGASGSWNSATTSDSPSSIVRGGFETIIVEDNPYYGDMIHVYDSDSGQEITSYIPIGHNNNIKDIVGLDYDQDSLGDFAYIEEDSSGNTHLYLYRNTGFDFVHYFGFQAPAGMTFDNLDAGDLDGDGKEDIVILEDEGTDELYIFENDYDSPDLYIPHQLPALGHTDSTHFDITVGEITDYDPYGNTDPHDEIVLLRNDEDGDDIFIGMVHTSFNTLVSITGQFTDHQEGGYYCFDTGRTDLGRITSGDVGYWATDGSTYEMMWPEHQSDGFDEIFVSSAGSNMIYNLNYLKWPDNDPNNDPNPCYPFYESSLDPLWDICYSVHGYKYIFGSHPFNDEYSLHQFPHWPWETPPPEYQTQTIEGDFTDTIDAIDYYDIDVEPFLDSTEYHVNIPISFSGDITFNNMEEDPSTYTWIWDVNANDGSEPYFIGRSVRYSFSQEVTGAEAVVATYNPLALEGDISTNHITLTYNVVKAMTDPNDRDSDGDGLWDGDEYFGDQQGLYKWEYHFQSGEWGWEPSGKDYDGIDNPSNYVTDPLKEDTDGDGLNDRQEVGVWNTNPYLKDTDGDKIFDLYEIIISETNPTRNVDDDNDGQFDEDPINNIDDDGDGVTDEDPDGYDTDGDGLPDGMDPIPIKADQDLDGLSDWEEINVWSTDPTDWDTDHDGINDYIDPSNVEDNGPPFVALAPGYTDVDHREEIYLIIKEKSSFNVYFSGDTNTDNPHGVDITDDGVEDFTITAVNCIGEQLDNSDLTLEWIEDDIYKLSWTVSGFRLDCIQYYQIAIVDIYNNYVIIEAFLGTGSLQGKTIGTQSIKQVDQQQYKTQVVASTAMVGAVGYGEMYLPWPVINYEIGYTLVSIVHGVTFGCVASIFILVAIAELPVPPDSPTTISTFTVDTIGVIPIDWYGTEPLLTGSHPEIDGNFYLTEGDVSIGYSGADTYIRGDGWKFINEKHPDLTVEMIDEALNNGELTHHEPGFYVVDYYDNDWGYGLRVKVVNNQVVDANKFDRIIDYGGREIIIYRDTDHYKKHKYPTRPNEEPITDEMVDDILENPDQVWYDNDGYKIYIKYIDGHWYLVITLNGVYVTGYNPDEPTPEKEREYIERALKKIDSTGEPMKKEYP